MKYVFYIALLIFLWHAIPFIFAGIFFLTAIPLIIQ